MNINNAISYTIITTLINNFRHCNMILTLTLLLNVYKLILIMAGMAVFYVAGYIIEERRSRPVITASPRGQCSEKKTLRVSPTEAGGTTVSDPSRSLPGHPGASRVIPIHGPGCRWKWRFFAEKHRGPQDPGPPRGTPVHPGRAPAGPRFIPALTRFTPVLGPVLQGSPRSMPAEPRWRYGSSRFSTAELRSFPVHHGSSRRGENAV